MSFDSVELLGYSASLLVAISLTMRNMWRLRWLNLIGSIAFAVYAVLVGAYPVVIVNTFIAGVNLFFLWDMVHGGDSFAVLPMSQDSLLVDRFVELHGRDLGRFFPDFSWPLCADKKERWTGSLVLRNTLPVGIFLMESNGPEIEVHVDYVVPQVRDGKNGRFVHDTLRDGFRRSGIERLTAHSEVPVHQAYLQRMGYRKTMGDPSAYEMPV